VTDQRRTSPDLDAVADTVVSQQGCGLVAGPPTTAIAESRLPRWLPGGQTGSTPAGGGVRPGVDPPGGGFSPDKTDHSVLWGYMVQVFSTRAWSFQAVIAASRTSFGLIGLTPSIMSISRMP
jgi:hypothetical protein